MIGTMVCLAVASLGIDVGWEPSDDGKGLEYIIQIEPEMLDSLRAGQKIRSDLRSDLGQIRSYRIQVGSGPVPKTNLPSSPPPPSPLQTKQPPALVTKEVPPATLPQDAVSKPIAKPADYREPSAVDKTETVPSVASSETPKDYFTAMLVLAGTSVGLLAALVYLAWIHVGTRNRYRALLVEHMTLGLSPPAQFHDQTP